MGVVLLLLAKELGVALEMCLLLASFWLVLKEVVTERPGSRAWGHASEQEVPLMFCILAPQSTEGVLLLY